MYNVCINFYTDGDLRYKPCLFEKEMDSYTNRTNVFCKTVDDGYNIAEKFLDNIIKQIKGNPKHECDLETFKAIRAELYNIYFDYVHCPDRFKWGDYISIAEDIGNMELEILIMPQEIEIWSINNSNECEKEKDYV